MGRCSVEEEKENFNVCRVCLSTNEEKCVSLFDKFHDYLVYDYINSIADVEIKRNDGLPNKICPACLLELETAVNFKEKCESSNASLHNRSNKIDTKVNITIVKKEERDSTEHVMDDTYDNNIQPSESSDLDVKATKEMTAKVKKATYNKTRPSRAINERVQCHDCGNHFKTKFKLGIHWKRVHLPQSLVCQNCKLTFRTFHAYKKHVESKYKGCIAATEFNIECKGKKRMFYCKRCNYKSPRISDLDPHTITHSGKRPYVCDICSNTYTQLSSLDRHKEMAHKQYKFETACQYCGKIIKGRDRIYKHLKRHTAQEVECEVCKKTFRNKDTLQVHMLRHMGIKSFTCKECPSAFYSQVELYKHRQCVHIKDKIYECDQCDYKSYRQVAVKKHKARHTQYNIPCTVCGKFFEKIEKHAKHQRVHFEVKEFSCPECDKTFVLQHSLVRHIKCVHKNNATEKGTVKKESISIASEGSGDD